MNTTFTTPLIKRAAFILLLTILSVSAAMADIPRTTLTDNCINSLPWSEDFEWFAANTVPDCWDNSASTSSSLNDYPEYLWGVHSYYGNKMLRMFNYYASVGTAIINSPMIVLPSEGEIELKFDYSHTATCGPFTVKISGDGGVTFVDLASYSNTSSSPSTLDPGEFTEAFIPLTEYAGQTVMIQFYANANYSNGAIFVDNIEIYVPPTCPNPYNITVDNITSTTAELSWNIPTNMQSYTVRYRPTQSIRFEEGFENGIYGWTLRDCHEQTGISDYSVHSGQYAFSFCYSSTPPQYLISPMLTGIDEDVSLKFYYRNRSTDYPETFQIGISYSDDATASFVFGNEITAGDEEWHLYSEPIPSGTKYICWKYTSDNQFHLYIDDIIVEASMPNSEWQIITVEGNGTQVSTILTDLTQSTRYEAQVKSNCDEAEWSEVISFTTHTDFENVFDMYTIYSATGWNLFCDALEDNDTYDRFIGKTVRLANDISVTRMAGSAYHDFMGTFDGQGHTLTIAYGTAENPISEEYAAPFRNLEDGADIHSLHVDGHIYTSNKYASGIVGCQYGTVTISNCRSSAIIHSSKSGDGTHGGIVATQHNTLTVTGCVFNGRLLTTNGTTFCSGLVGYHTNGTCTISDCLYAPAEVNFASDESYINTGATFCRNYSGMLDNCYYTKTLGEAQGKLAHSIIPGEGVLMEMVGEATEYDVSDITIYSTGIMYDDVLYASNGDQVSFSLMAPESFYAVTYTPEGGTATEITPVNGVYTFTMPDADVVIDAVTEYLIHNATEWNNFCDALQDNDTYNRFIDRTVRLCADISVTRMAGSDYHDFMGTFDGQGHTLTVAYGSAENPISEEYAAPFRNVENGANIHGLHVDGHIYTSNKYASGIAGCQWGTVSISNCRSGVIIHSSKSGDGTHGGIVAVQHNTLTVNGCVFNGRLLTTNGTTLCGGLIGWRYGTITLSDCLYAPAEVTQASGETCIATGATFCRNYSDTPANCYYTEVLGTAQGKQAHSITGGEGITVENAGTATTYDVSGITSYGTGIEYDNVLYAGYEDEVSLNLGMASNFNTNEIFHVSAGTLNGTSNPYTLIMPDQNVSIIIPCPTPFDFATDNITATTAVLSWIIMTDMENYTVRYRDTQSVVPVYYEGFENGLGDWTLRNCVEHTGICGNPVHSGEYAFRFYYSSTPPQYLISPMLTGIDEGMRLEFYYRNYSTNHRETFQIGFSSTNDATASFVFGNEITAMDTQWHLYSEFIPSGTKYICWKCTSNNQYYLFIDDIVLVDDSSNSVWQTLSVNGDGTQVNATLTSLTPGTCYEAQVKSNCDEAMWSEIISFTTNNIDITGDTLIIYNTSGWDFFCDALQDNDTWNRFIGMTVKLAADISVTRMAGSAYHDFMGTFDGQGHTLTIAYGKAIRPFSEEYAAPFRYVENGANIHSLHVDGHIYTSNKFAGGIVGCQWGTVSVSNCRSSVVIHSSKNGDGTHGGIVAYQRGGVLTVSGCVYDGHLLTTNGTTLCGGLVGNHNNGTCTISDCLYAPAEVTQAPGESYINNGATFCRNYNGTFDNCYYTEMLGTAQGKLAIANPAVTPVGEPTASYDVSDLTFYGNGVQFGDVFYYDSERNFLRPIAGYGTGNGAWQLIASPVVEVVTPSAGNGFLTNAYDLYAFVPNPSDNLEWRNYVAEPFNLEAGKGYVYANSGDVTLVFSGTPTAATAPFAVPLNYDADDDRKCWNLVGNPFACAAYLDRPYYLIDANGMGINPEPIQPTTPIQPCTAVFVKAVAAGDTAVFGTQP